jgi:hypothetical protein
MSSHWIEHMLGDDSCIILNQTHTFCYSLMGPGRLPWQGNHDIPERDGQLINAKKAKGRAGALYE